jgi:predicted MFS family arabinose efflux permease
MPLRYFIFSTLVLTAAFGLSTYVAKIQQKESKVKAQSISGSSIAPGGVGGRQSQFSAVFGG